MTLEDSKEMSRKFTITSEAMRSIPGSSSHVVTLGNHTMRDRDFHMSYIKYYNSCPTAGFRGITSHYNRETKLQRKIIQKIKAVEERKTFISY